MDVRTGKLGVVRRCPSGVGYELDTLTDRGLVRIESPWEYDCVERAEDLEGPENMARVVKKAGELEAKLDAMQEDPETFGGVRRQ